MRMNAPWGLIGVSTTVSTHRAATRAAATLGTLSTAMDILVMVC